MLSLICISDMAQWHRKEYPTPPKRFLILQIRTSRPQFPRQLKVVYKELKILTVKSLYIYIKEETLYAHSTRHTDLHQHFATSFVIPPHYLNLYQKKLSYYKEAFHYNHLPDNLRKCYKTFNTALTWVSAGYSILQIKIIPH